MKGKYLYGPIVSRRLGNSLGINVMPSKICSLDCVYCECGGTRDLTLERKEYAPTDQIIQELDEYLKTSPDLDYITFSGSGEPTLHTGLGKIISFIKENYNHYKVAVLTNSTLLNNRQVIEDLQLADLVVPSLDGVSQEAFEKIDRPHKKLQAEQIISGIKKLTNNYNGEIWVEVFIAPGINDTQEELKSLKNVLQELKVSKVQLNSLDRPGAVEWIKPASKKRLREIASYLGDIVEIV